MSAVNLVKAALPALRQSDSAAILFITSTSVKQPLIGMTISNSIRGAVSGLAKDARQRARACHPRQLAAPGTIRTDRQIDLARAAGITDLDTFFETAGKVNPLGRVGEPDEIARVCRIPLFPCSVVRHRRLHRRGRGPDSISRLTSAGCQYSAPIPSVRTESMRRASHFAS